MEEGTSVMGEALQNILKLLGGCGGRCPFASHSTWKSPCLTSESIHVERHPLTTKNDNDNGGPPTPPVVESRDSLS